MGYLSLLPWEQNTEKLIPATKMTHRKTQKWWVTHLNPAFDTRHLTHTHLAWQDKSTNTQVGEEGLTPRPGYPLPDTRHLIDTRRDMTQQQQRHNGWVGKVGALVRAPHPGPATSSSSGVYPTMIPATSSTPYVHSTLISATSSTPGVYPESEKLRITHAPSVQP